MNIYFIIKYSYFSKFVSIFIYILYMELYFKLFNVNKPNKFIFTSFVII